MERPTELKRNISERRLVDVLVSFLRSKSRVEREVKHYEKSIDVVSMCSNTCEIHAIEVKTKNWNRALQQAIVNLAVAEKSYVAMHSKYVHCVNIEELQENGIGLISVGSSWGDVEIIREAQQSAFVNKIANCRIKQWVQSKG
ncbi:MAG: hypothetical protein PHY02_05055 [Phycisphaerae bacterium]|nr:hypothetical protein [Phycisphaerae bacterium]